MGGRPSYLWHSPLELSHSPSPSLSLSPFLLTAASSSSSSLSVLHDLQSLPILKSLPQSLLSLIMEYSSSPLLGAISTIHGALLNIHNQVELRPRVSYHREVLSMIFLHDEWIAMNMSVEYGRNTHSGYIAILTLRGEMDVKTKKPPTTIGSNIKRNQKGRGRKGEEKELSIQSVGNTNIPFILTHSRADSSEAGRSSSCSPPPPPSLTNSSSFPPLLPSSSSSFSSPIEKSNAKDGHQKINLNQLTLTSDAKSSLSTSPPSLSSPMNILNQNGNISPSHHANHTHHHIRQESSPSPPFSPPLSPPSPPPLHFSNPNFIPIDFLSEDSSALPSSSSSTSVSPPSLSSFPFSSHVYDDEVVECHRLYAHSNKTRCPGFNLLSEFSVIKSLPNGMLSGLCVCGKLNIWNFNMEKMVAVKMWRTQLPNAFTSVFGTTPSSRYHPHSSSTSNELKDNIYHPSHFLCSIPNGKLACLVSPNPQHYIQLHLTYSIPTACLVVVDIGQKSLSTPWIVLEPNHYATSLFFLPGSQYLVSEWSDGVIRVWDFESMTLKLLSQMEEKREKSTNTSSGTSSGNSNKEKEREKEKEKGREIRTFSVDGKEQMDQGGNTATANSLSNIHSNSNEKKEILTNSSNNEISPCKEMSPSPSPSPSVSPSISPSLLSSPSSSSLSTSFHHHNCLFIHSHDNILRSPGSYGLPSIQLPDGRFFAIDSNLNICLHNEYGECTSQFKLKPANYKNKMSERNRSSGIINRNGHHGQSQSQSTRESIANLNDGGSGNGNENQLTDDHDHSFDDSSLESCILGPAASAVVTADGHIVTTHFSSSSSSSSSSSDSDFSLYIWHLKLDSSLYGYESLYVPARKYLGSVEWPFMSKLINTSPQKLSHMKLRMKRILAYS